MFTTKLIVIAAIATAISAGQSKTDPEKALWSALKRALTSDNGEDYWESKVKNCELPRLKGVVTTAVLNDGVSKIVLAMSDAVTPEVTLIVHQGDVKVKTQPYVGQAIEFSGEAVEFTKSPFMLTFDVAIRNVTGLDTDHGK